MLYRGVDKVNLVSYYTRAFARKGSTEPDVGNRADLCIFLSVCLKRQHNALQVSLIKVTPNCAARIQSSYAYLASLPLSFSLVWFLLPAQHLHIGRGPYRILCFPCFPSPCVLSTAKQSHHPPAASGVGMPGCRRRGGRPAHAC